MILELSRYRYQKEIEKLSISDFTERLGIEDMSWEPLTGSRIDSFEELSLDWKNTSIVGLSRRYARYVGAPLRQKVSLITFTDLSGQQPCDVTRYKKPKYFRQKIYERMVHEMRPLYIRQLANQFITNIEKSVVDYCIESLKRKLGHEYYFDMENGGKTVYEITNKFLKKLDKNFIKHTQRLDNGDYCITLNSSFIITLKDNTYMYVATGSKTPNLSNALYMETDVNPRDMYIYIFGKKTYKYCKYLEKFIRDLYVNNDLGIYTIDARKDEKNGESLDVIYQKMNTRDISTLFYSNNERELICNHIDKFLENEKFYNDRQILYKTGILLYGKPGTGKSSLVKAIATKYNRSIININTSKLSSIDLNSLTQSINIDDKKYIILIEDIDTLFLDRLDGQANKDDLNVINKLLQFLDSNTSPTNVIFIATTNHREKLDEALLRDGRFDLKVEVSGLSKETALKFCHSFGLNEIQSIEVVNSLITNDNDGINQSTLQSRILAKLENKSVEKAEELYGDKSEKTGNENS